MNNNNFFKYMFAIVVIFLIGYTIFIIFQNKEEIHDYNLDQTSTVNNIQTDLRFAISEMDTINPLLTKNRNVQEITKIIYDSLVTLDGNYKLEYCLAEEIAKTDELTYVVKLRKGILWENGTNFTAYDVLFTFDLLKGENRIDSVYSENVKYVTEVQVIDSNTLKIVLSNPVPFFEYNLTFPIMSQTYYEGEDFVESEKIPIGTGMFKISEISTNIIKLIQNELYWDTSKKPMATEININLYNSIGEAYAAFKNGEIDLLTVKITNIEDYIGTLGYNKIEYKTRNYDFLAFNNSKDVLSESAVRKAISLAIDKNNIVATCEGLGTGYVSSNFNLDMGCWLYTKDLNVGIDTQQAAQILLNNGWERTASNWIKRTQNGTKKLEFSISVNANNTTRISVAENIKKQLANFGVPVTIHYLSVDNYANAINNRNYDVIITGIQNSYSPSVYTFFGNGNIANYNNSEVSEIMNTIHNTTDENILYEKYSRLYEIYLEDAPYIGLFRETDVIVYNQSLVGNITANSFNIYHNIEKWYRQ